MSQSSSVSCLIQLYFVHSILFILFLVSICNICYDDKKNKNSKVYITSSKSSEPKRFVRRLNKFERKYIQEQQPNWFHCYNQNMFFFLFFLTDWNRALPSTGLVSEWKNGSSPRVLEWSMLFLITRGCCIVLTKIKRLCFS